MHIWDLNLRHLRAVLEVTRLGSISAAAQAVSLTQPAVTQGIARLERELGRPLFARRADGMVPTPAALLLRPRLDAALTHIGSVRVTMAQVRALISVGTSGSLAEASHDSGLSQPTLHRAVKDLGLALRRTITERRGRGIALTEAGQRVLRGFRLARAELVAALTELQALDGVEVGRVAIGAMPLSRARLLPSAIAAFHRSHPDVTIHIVEGSHTELIDPLRDGELDLLIGALRLEVPPAEVDQQPLFDDQPVVFARPGHPLIGHAAPWSALADYPWVVPPSGTPLRTQWEAMFKAAGLPVPLVSIECGAVITVRQLIRDSDFLTLLSPDQLAVELQAGVVAQVGTAPGDLRRTIGITTRSGWRPTPAQAAFIRALEDTAKGISSTIS